MKKNATYKFANEKIFLKIWQNPKENVHDMAHCQ